MSEYVVGMVVGAAIAIVGILVGVFLTKRIIISTMTPTPNNPQQGSAGLVPPQNSSSTAPPSRKPKDRTMWD